MWLELLIHIYTHIHMRKKFFYFSTNFILAKCWLLCTVSLYKIVYKIKCLSVCVPIWYPFPNVTESLKDFATNFRNFYFLNQKKHASSATSWQKVPMCSMQTACELDSSKLIECQWLQVGISVTAIWRKRMAGKTYARPTVQTTEVGF